MRDRCRRLIILREPLNDFLISFDNTRDGINLHIGYGNMIRESRTKIAPSLSLRQQVREGVVVQPHVIIETVITVLWVSLSVFSYLIASQTQHLPIMCDAGNRDNK